MFFHCFSEKIKLDVSSESSAMQKTQMKNQALFSSKDKSKKLKYRLWESLFGAFRVKIFKNANTDTICCEIQLLWPPLFMNEHFFFFCSRQNFFKLNQFIHDSVIIDISLTERKRSWIRIYHYHADITFMQLQPFLLACRQSSGMTEGTQIHMSSLLQIRSGKIYK